MSGRHDADRGRQTMDADNAAGTGTSDRATARVPVDGHVHLHRLELVEPTLDAAAENFRAHAGGQAGMTGALLLTQARGERVFEQLARQNSAGAWRISACTKEAQSLLAERDGRTVAIVCGRQIRCERGLEVTALGTVQEFPDGESLDESIARVQASGALAVLPWGFGKWTGARGATVRQVLERHSPDTLAVCDNGGRLQWQGRPALVRLAAQRGFRVLPGTDPFPFGGGYRRAGAFGFLVEGEPDPAGPWQSIAGALLSRPDSPVAYGRALGPLRFVYNNVGIQVYNRLRAGSRT